MSKSYLITGGTGFLGSALVMRLVRAGHRVRVLDNNSRGKAERLREVDGDFEFIEADIRDADKVNKACHGMDSVCHLAYVNGTEFFYSMPELVLEIAVAGMLNVLNGCIKSGTSELILASSSEVYQTPPTLPTDETVSHFLFQVPQSRVIRMAAVKSLVSFWQSTTEGNTFNVS